MNILGSYMQTVWSDGSLKVPAQYFASEPGLGICRTFTGTQSNFTIAQAGTAVAKFGTGGTTFAGTVTAPAFVGTGSIVDSKYVVAAGQANPLVPSFTWAEDTTSGLSSDGAGSVDYVYQGSDLMSLRTGGLFMKNGNMLYASSGSNTGLPGFSFANNPTTGIYETISPSKVGIACDSASVAIFGTGGSTVTALSASSISVSGTAQIIGTSSLAGATTSGPIYLANGTGTAPSLGFSNSTSSGLFFDISGGVGITSGGSEVVSITPSLAFIGATTTQVTDLLAGRLRGTTALPIRIDSGNVADFNSTVGLVQLARSQLNTVAALPSSGTTNFCLTFGTKTGNLGVTFVTTTTDTVNGDTFTIVQPGLYSFRIGGCTSIGQTGGAYIGVSRNCAGTTANSSWTQAQTIGLRFMNSGSDIITSESYTAYLSAGDVIRCCAGIAATLTSISSSTWFEIIYVTGTQAVL